MAVAPPAAAPRADTITKARLQGLERRPARVLSGGMLSRAILVPDSPDLENALV